MNNTKEKVFYPDLPQYTIDSASYIILESNIDNAIGKKCYQHINGLDKPCDNYGLKCAIKCKETSFHQKLDEPKILNKVFVNSIDKSSEKITMAYVSLGTESDQKQNVDEKKTLTSVTPFQKTEELQSKILNNSIEGIFVVQDEYFKYINPAIKRYTGYTEEEIKHIHFATAIHPDDRALVIENNKKRLSAEDIEPYNIRIQRKNGTYFWASINATLVEWNKKPAVLCFAKNVDKQIVIQNKLIESEKKYRLLVENQGEGIGITDEKNVFTFSNPAADRIFGVKNGLIGRSLNEFVTSKEMDKILDETNKRKQEESSTYNFSIVLATGELKTLLITVSPKLDDNGTFEGFFGVFRDITELKKAEQQVHNLLNNLHGAAYRSDEMHCFNYVSEYISQLTGYPSETLLDSSSEHCYKSLIYKKDIDYVETTLKNSLDNPEGYSIEYRISHKSGNLKWMLEIGKSVIIDGERCLEGFIIDITERKQIERGLKRSEAQFKSLFNSISDSIFLQDFETGKMITCNNYAIQKYGYSREEFKQLDASKINRGFSLSSLKERIKKHTTPRFFETSHIKKNGTSYPVEIGSQLISYKGKKAIISVIRDITSRKKQEQAIAYALAFNKNIVQNASEGIIVYNKNLEVIVWNRATELITGIAAEEVKGKLAVELFHKSHENNWADALKKVLQGDSIVRELVPFTFYTLNKSGYAREVYSPFIDDNGDVQGVICIISDISNLIEAQNKISQKNDEIGKQNTKLEVINSELEKINQQYQQANTKLSDAIENLNNSNIELKQAKLLAEENDKLKSAFLANISHEIRTPLNGIMGFSSLLKKSGLSQEKIKKYSSIISNNGEQLLNVVTDIIDISKLQTLQVSIDKDDFNLCDLFNDLHEIYKTKAEQANVKLTVSCIEKPITVYSDRLHLRKVLCHLIDNAIKFANNSEVNISSINSSGKIWFYVNDKGLGIPQDKLDSIFDPFRQADPDKDSLIGGTGLGLSITKGFVELLGGELFIESKLNEGSSFYFYINNEHSDDTTLVEEESFSSNQKQEFCTILIAEDEYTNYDYLSEVLTDLGYKLIHALNGQEAVDLVQENQIDLVLMDIKMPVLNGYHAFTEIRRMGFTMPIVAQTAYALKTDKQQIIKHGFDAYLSKPLNIGSLMETIECLIEK